MRRVGAHASFRETMGLARARLRWAVYVWSMYQAASPAQASVFHEMFCRYGRCYFTVTRGHGHFPIRGGSTSIHGYSVEYLNILAKIS
jgi:hypothetical protein